MSHLDSGKVRLRYVNVIHTRVIGIRPYAEGWWFHFEGSRESILFPTKAFEIHDHVKITFDNLSEKERNAQPHQPPI